MRGELLHVVRYDNARESEPLIHLPDEAEDHTHGDGVEAHERLVVDEHLRIHHDRARQRRTARHAAGAARAGMRYAAPRSPTA